MQQERYYYLVIRVGKNSFLPIISNIFLSIVSVWYLKPDDLFSSMEILYVENGKNHTVKEGPIFLEDNHIISEGFLIEYIINNKNNKELINNIIMQCNIKENDELLDSFKTILRNNSSMNEDDDVLREYLNIFKDLTYSQKRAICVRVSNSIYNAKQKEQAKEKKLEDKRKVA